MRVAIIGSGFTGIAAAYEVTRSGHKAIILERDNRPGGLAATFQTSGQELEKFYHHWLGTDEEIFGLIRELGHGDKLRFHSSKVGIYYANSMYRFSSPLDLLRFKPLPFFSRIRFGLSIIYSWTIKDSRYLETVTAEEWLIKVAGRKAYETVWRPLLIGKFGTSHYKQVAAIWIWNKLIQRGKSRDKKAKEVLGYYKGGFKAFISDLIDSISNSGGEIEYNSEVKQVRPRPDGTVDLKIGSDWRNFDRVIYTGHTPELASVMETSGFFEEAEKAKRIDYLANICLILETTESLSETYWLNVNDTSFPFVAIIEHTNFETTETYGGKHLIYLSKYIQATDELYALSADEMTEFAIPHLKRLFPQFDITSIESSHLWKADYAQPIICKNYSDVIPQIKTSIPNFFVSTMAQVYPQDRGTNYAVKNGREVGRMVVASKTHLDEASASERDASKIDGMVK